MPGRIILFSGSGNVGQGGGMRKKREEEKSRILPAAWI